MLRGWHRVPLPVKGRFRAGPNCPGPSLLPFPEPPSSPSKRTTSIGLKWGEAGAISLAMFPLFLLHHLYCPFYWIFSISIKTGCNFSQLKK